MFNWRFIQYYRKLVGTFPSNVFLCLGGSTVGSCWWYKLQVLWNINDIPFLKFEKLSETSNLVWGEFSSCRRSLHVENTIAMSICLHRTWSLHVISVYIPCVTVFMCFLKLAVVHALMCTLCGKPWHWYVLFRLVWAPRLVSFNNCVNTGVWLHLWFIYWQQTLSVDLWVLGTRDSQLL